MAQVTGTPGAPEKARPRAGGAPPAARQGAQRRRRRPGGSAQGDTVTVKGNCPDLVEGQSVLVRAEWEDHPGWGLQLKVWFGALDTHNNP
jgi:hypothetical protein